MKLFKLLSISLVAICLLSLSTVAVADDHEAKSHHLEFSLPSENSKPPEISRGPATLYVDAGDELELSVAGEGNTVMLVIESAGTPFASGKYRVTINSGNSNSKKLRMADRPGSYKYSIVDISNRQGSADRPVLDPIIIIKD